jgi:RNA 3'-terminal phosphate cyclase (ATP)
MITISGSYGEGGGQILRTALSLSSIMSVPVRICGIRANRPKPGLRPQHLTGVLALAELTRAEVAGAGVGSMDVTFVPHGARAGDYRFDVSRIGGSAGSVTLILQTLLPVLALSDGRSHLILVGGTHVPWSPPYHFIAGCFLPAVSRMGLDAEVSISKWGFYPKGGGEARAEILPAERFKPVELMDRGRLVRVSGISAVAGLPETIAARMAKSASELLAGNGVEAEFETVNASSPGQGAFIYISAEFENITLGFSALGERGKRAEAVGAEAASSLLDFIATGSAVEERLADQLLIYMSLAALRGGVSRMSVSRVTGHLLTNAWVIRQLLPEVRIDIDGAQGERGLVEVKT